MRKDSSSFETHSQSSLSGGPPKRIRISEGMSRGERVLRGDGCFASRGVQTFPEPLSRVQETGSEVEYLKKRLTERKINHKLLWDKFIDQEILLKRAESKRKQLEKKEAKIIAQAFKAAFFAGFKKYKSIAQVHLLLNFIKHL